MAFAGAFRAHQQHDPVRPFRPPVDQRDTGSIGRPFQEIVARQAFGMRQRKCQLTGLYAACHAKLHAGTSRRLIPSAFKRSGHRRA